MTTQSLLGNHSSRRATGAISVVVLHAVIIYALATGLGRQVVEVIRAPLETRVIDEAKPPPEKLPPPPMPKLAPPPPAFVPLPEFKVQTAPSNNAIREVVTAKPAVEVPFAPPAPAEVKHVPPSANAAKPCASPQYPSISRRMEETGTVVLGLLVDVDGRVLDSKVQQSTGSPRLDNAAREAVKVCQFTPGTADGKLEEAWGTYRYTFTLQ